MHVFLVRLDGHPVYGGIFLFPLSAMGIDSPVIHASFEEGRLHFTLRPIHEVTGDYSQYEPEWNGIKDPRIRQVFEAAGVLTP